MYVGVVLAFLFLRSELVFLLFSVTLLYPKLKQTGISGISIIAVRVSFVDRSGDTTTTQIRNLKSSLEMM